MGDMNTDIRWSITAPRAQGWLHAFEPTLPEVLTAAPLLAALRSRITVARRDAVVTGDQRELRRLLDRVPLVEIARILFSKTASESRAVWMIILSQVYFTFNQAQKRVVNAALSNTFGFGGHNATVIGTKFRG